VRAPATLFGALHYSAGEALRLTSFGLDEAALGADIAARRAAVRSGLPASSADWPASDALEAERDAALSEFDAVLTKVGQFALAWIGCSELHRHPKRHGPHEPW
jgi:hypothetical protein